MHFNWVWPDVSDKASARKAVKEGVAACAFIAGVDAAIAIYANVVGRTVGGYGASVLIDGAVFALLALFLLKNSRTAAVLALALMALEIADKVAHHASTFNLVTMVLFLAILNAVRGAFAFHRPENPAKMIDAATTTPQPLG